MKGAQQTEKEEEAYGEIGQGSFTTNSRERRRATNHVGRGADVGECSTIARGRSWAKGLCQLEINLGARKSGRRRAGGLSKGAGRHGRIPSSRTNNMHHTMHTSFACPDACSMTLAAFTSRWATPWRCMWRKAATTSAAYARAVPSGNPLPSRLPTTSTQHGSSTTAQVQPKVRSVRLCWGACRGTREPNSRHANIAKSLHLQRDLLWGTYVRCAAKSPPASSSNRRQTLTSSWLLPSRVTMAGQGASATRASRSRASQFPPPSNTVALGTTFRATAMSNEPRQAQRRWREEETRANQGLAEGGVGVGWRDPQPSAGGLHRPAGNASYLRPPCGPAHWRLAPRTLLATQWFRFDQRLSCTPAQGPLWGCGGRTDSGPPSTT